MILLDTNIISEMMKSAPSTKVAHWIDEQETARLFISTITIAEISYRINALTTGKKKQTLENSFESILQEAFKHRILFFDEHAAHVYGKLMGHRKKIGRPLSVLDGQIASVALAHRKMLATRNIRDFLDCELELVNPFDH